LKDNSAELLTEATRCHHLLLKVQIDEDASIASLFGEQSAVTWLGGGEMQLPWSNSTRSERASCSKARLTSQRDPCYRPRCRSPSCQSGPILQYQRVYPSWSALAPG